MRYDSFLHAVQKRTELSDELEASTAVTATLNTLAERLQPGERESVAARLPQDLKNLVTVEGEATEMSLDQFFDRVSQRMGAEREQAEDIADEILSILNEEITAAHRDDIKKHLPEEYRPLFETESR